MKGFWTVLSYSLVSAALTTSCIASGGYWIPPSSLTTRPPEVAVLPEVEIAALDPSPTPESLPVISEPVPSQTAESEPTLMSFSTLQVPLNADPTEEFELNLPTLPPPTLTPEI